MEEKKIEKVELTIEDYKKAVEILKAQNTQLLRQLQNAEMLNLFKRLDYLFKVVETAAMFDEPFVEQCITEIKSIIIPPEIEESTED